MKKNKIIGIIFLVLFVFISFIILDPMVKGSPLEKDKYTLNTKGMNSIQKHTPPIFYLRKDNIFSIQPSPTSAAKANLTFKENIDLVLSFSIPKHLEEGKLSFIIQKNKKVIKKFSLDRQDNNYFDLEIKVKKGDEITIITDLKQNNLESTGKLQILKYMDYYSFKFFIIPLLWVLLLIYLVRKGYIYIGLSGYFGFLLFLIAEKITFGPLLYRDILIYMAFFFLYIFIFILIYQELQVLKRLKIASLLKLISTILILFIPTTFILFAMVFGKPINWDILYAIYQTNFDESIGFIQTFIPTFYLVILFLFIAIIGYIFMLQESRERKVIGRFFLIVVVVLLSVYVSKKYYKPRIVYIIQKSYKDYNKEIEDLIAFQEKRKNQEINFSATKKEKGEIYVVVIGESLNKYNMSLYGHFRNTTPKQLQQMQQDQLYTFDNVYSNAGNTLRSLSFAITEANQYNKKSFLESLSFVDIFNKAGFDTYWITTQGRGQADNVLSIISQSSKHIINLVNDIRVESGVLSKYDEALVDIFKENISIKKNTLYVIHLLGSHFRYKDRYPKKYAHYKQIVPYIIGTNNETVLKDYNHYDNSIYYNDYVVSNLMNILKAQGRVSAFIYFSDHAEDIAKHRGHTSRLASFRFAMIQTPMTAWFSPEYKKRYPNVVKTFLSHENALFSNDMIYDTVIGLAQIKTDRYNSIYDLTSSQYNIDRKNALTLHGRLHYADPKNFYYWQKSNFKFLKDQNITARFVAVNSDTVGSFNDAWNIGFRSFEVNLDYKESKKSFQTGIKDYDTGGNFIDLLSYFQVKKIKKLFLNLTNLDSSNSLKILNRLKYIDQKLHLKNTTVLIINNLELVKIYKDAGWKVASKIMNSNDNSIDYFIVDPKGYENQKIVKKGIIIEHALNLSDSNLEKKLNDMQYIKDQKVDCLFIDFKSEYNE